jgi:predicted transcriptional regulator
MNKSTITFRLDASKKKALDHIAESMDRDRSYVLGEAVDTYLRIRHWQLSHIREGLRQAKAGRLAQESEVKAAFHKWRK